MSKVSFIANDNGALTSIKQEKSKFNPTYRFRPERNKFI